MLDRKVWIAALRDPSNKQAQAVLMHRSGAMCCLGLALVLVGEPHRRPSQVDCYYFGAKETVSFPDSDQIERIGIQHSLATALAACNDSGVTFAQIADFLETGNADPLIEALVMSPNSGFTRTSDTPRELRRYGALTLEKAA